MSSDFERLIAVLRRAHQRAPDLRLGQLIAAVALHRGNTCPDIALINDDELLRRLDKFAETGRIEPLP